MKLFIGILSTILVLTGATLIILAIWNIQPISWTIILRTGATIALICVTIIVVWLLKTIFFQKDLFKHHSKNKATPHTHKRVEPREKILAKKNSKAND